MSLRDKINRINAEIEKIIQPRHSHTNGEICSCPFNAEKLLTLYQIREHLLKEGHSSAGILILEESGKDSRNFFMKPDTYKESETDGTFFITFDVQ